MGGQNHQPTNRVRLIAPSAWLSQRVGEAFSSVLQSNSELENAIMAGMDRLHVEDFVTKLDLTVDEYMVRSIDKLANSLSIVDEIQAAYGNLIRAADAENYRGNPLASRLQEFDLPSKFTGTLVLPGLNLTAWGELERRISKDNILATLAWEATEFAKVVTPTRALIEVLTRCQMVARSDGGRRMVEAIECNEIGLRQEFARVFSLWNHLHALFLYSALAMTELFYRTNSLGTLLEEPTCDSRATA